MTTDSETTCVRCPADSCGAEFDVRSERLGRNLFCPVCRVRMSLRPAEVTARLAALERNGADHEVAIAPRLPLAVLVDNVRSLWNIGSIFRSADACGVRRVVLAGISGRPPRAQISKTALGADEVVAWRYRAEGYEALREIVAEGYTPVAIETTPRAESLARFTWPSRPCIVVGNEVAGITPAVLEGCAHHVALPMRGVKESLNVAVAFGIAAHAAAGAIAPAESPVEAGGAR